MRTAVDMAEFYTDVAAGDKRGAEDRAERSQRRSLAAAPKIPLARLEFKDPKPTVGRRNQAEKHYAYRIRF